MYPQQSGVLQSAAYGARNSSYSVSIDNVSAVPHGAWPVNTSLQRLVLANGSQVKRRQVGRTFIIRVSSAILCNHPPEHSCTLTEVFDTGTSGSRLYHACSHMSQGVHSLLYPQRLQLPTLFTTPLIQGPEGTSKESLTPRGQ